MAKIKRQIIEVDEEQCDGCGLCIPACPEGALQIVAGKARLVRESFCDGLGACLGECPQGALRMVELEVDAYDEAGVITHLRQKSPQLLEKHLAHLRAHAAELLPQPPPMAACPSVQQRQWHEGNGDEPAPESGRMRSELRQWPVQLHLVPPRAPFFQDANLTLVADCVPFAHANFHADFLRGSAVAVGCPKLDDANAYVDKLTQILQGSTVRGLKVVYMEVPCCRGLMYIAQKALENSGKEIPLESVVIRIGP
jgi:Pyruvate/2-oxoacid:ferredoxin oxidoreductase delta subunit